MSQVAPILLSSADRRTRDRGPNKKTEATIAIVIICSQSDGNVFKFDLQLCLHFMRAAAKNQLTARNAKIMKNNLFSRQNPCYGLTITGGHGLSRLAIICIEAERRVVRCNLGQLITSGPVSLSRV